MQDFPGGSLLRIEPVRKEKKREDLEFECVAENGVGDPVSAKASLEVYDGEESKVGRRLSCPLRRVSVIMGLRV